MKKIGIVGWKTGDNSFGATIAYVEYFQQFGKVVILGPQKGIEKDLDLLVLPGGKDIMTDKYSQIPSMFNSDPNMILEYFDNVNLGQYINAGTPIFGICRGFQALNVFFGGSLDQNIGHEYSSTSRGELVHEVISTHTNFKQKVNSLHHQGILSLGNGLVPTLLEKKSSVIEAFKHSELPIHGVQWHPEEIYDTYTGEVLKLLLNHKQLKLQKANAEV